MTALWIAAMMMGCAPTATAPGDVELDIVAGRFDEACAGLEAEDPELRKYTAERLVTFPDQAVATECLCKRSYDATAGTVDLVVTDAFAKSKRDDLATCLVPALTDARVAEPAVVAASLAGMLAPAGFTALADVLKTGKTPESRAAAAVGLKKSAKHAPELVAAVTSDADPAVRAAAAASLSGKEDPGLVAALTKVLAEDHPNVRAAAAYTLAVAGTPESDAAACKAFIDDAVPEVRAAPLRAWNGVNRDTAVVCLGKKLVHEEPEESIRVETLRLLTNVRTPAAKRALCEGIGPYVKNNVTTALPTEESKSDIIQAQNLVDWDQSYKCVQKALGQNGLSCYGKYHLASWMIRLGGRTSAKKCEGMVTEAAIGGGGGGGSEMSFE